MRARKHILRTALLALAAALSGAGPDSSAPPQADRPITRYVRFQVGQTVSYGLVENDRVCQIAPDPFGPWSRTGITYPLVDVRLLVPTEPTKILALIGNYATHLGTQPASATPEVFFKPPSALLPEGGTILLPADSRDVHHEGELVIVIGRKAKNVSVRDAPRHVLGITCGNDVSARDWQQNDRQWWRAKGADTFAPCGPFVVSGLRDEDLLLELRVNGQVRQHQRTRDMIHGIPEIVSWISRFVTLEPGDLIYTGTPGTTGPLKPGDLVEVSLEGVGMLRNRVAAAPE